MLAKSILNFSLIILLCNFFPYAYGNSKLSAPPKKTIKKIKTERPIINWPGKRHEVMEEYEKVHKKFRKQLCTPGTEEKFFKLNRAYRGDGFFVPTLPNDKIDKDVIQKYMPELLKKISWIEGEHKKLKNLKNYTKLKNNLKGLTRYVDKILNKKQEFYKTKKTEDKLRIRAESSKLLLAFQGALDKFLKKITFLHGYHFPVNHFELRKEYDSFKNKKTFSDKHKSNDIYFYRKMVEDGAQDPDHRKSDVFFRASLNSIMVNLKKEKGIISEKLRYDLEEEFDRLKVYLRWSKKRHLSRLMEWRDRIKRKHHFYEKLISKDFEKIEKDIIGKKSKALHELKSFVYSRQAETFKFWSEESELMRALYVMETILFNEVGDVDGRDALERWDVLQVVINRLNDPKYSSIRQNDYLKPHLDLIKDLKYSEYKWLNVLFQQGEFSFTYYFIPMNIRVFCPDMTRRGRFLRNENIKLGLKKLQKPSPNFKAVRYFSRASMLGKVDMALLWGKFTALPERPGLRAKRSRSLVSAYKKGRYRFLYPFRDGRKRLFNVVQIKNKTYVLRVKNKKFYKYRNPHYFTYFKAD